MCAYQLCMSANVSRTQRITAASPPAAASCRGLTTAAFASRGVAGSTATASAAAAASAAATAAASASATAAASATAVASLGACRAPASEQ